MIYRVIGLMSGSSLDGLDIVYTVLSEVAGKWEYQIEHAECVSYTEEWHDKLSKSPSMSLQDYLNLDAAYGKYLGQAVLRFIHKYDLEHKVHFIASHGHTVYHSPQNGVSAQIGSGAIIAAVTGISTISDLRNMDIALGGQGAPIVPIADRLLFGNYDFCLNLGGIANVTVNNEGPTAFDICPANQVLNYFAQKLHKPYDDQGLIAAKGKLNSDLLEQLSNLDYYKQTNPKSLDNTFSQKYVIPLVEKHCTNPQDALHTATVHVATEIVNAIQVYTVNAMPQKMLVTGGGAFNTFLISKLQDILSLRSSVQIMLPETKLVDFKEALAMALIGALRWREEYNVLKSVSGAQRNSVGGAIWIGNL